MLKPVLTLAAVGVLGIAIWRILLPWLGPVLGFLVGLFFFAAKIALLVGLVFFALWLFRKSQKNGEARQE